MRPTSRDHDDDELDLPGLDGESEEEDPASAADDLDLGAEDDGEDAFDDAAAGDAVEHGVAIGDDEGGGLLADSEDAAGLDVGVFDLALGEEGEELLDDHAEGRGTDEDLDLGDEAETADGGEEGPLAEDEELREEDLPALDADDDGDVADDELYDRTALSAEDELRWDDRAWDRVEHSPAGADPDAPEESGALAVPGEDPAHRARDAAWRALEETGRMTAAVVLPGASVVVAVATPDWGRVQLVRVALDGVARIIAEIDPREDNGEACKVTHLRWDGPGNRLVAAGTFGVVAFRPT